MCIRRAAGCFVMSIGVHRNIIQGAGVQIQLRTEDRDLGAVAPLIRGSGGSCDFVQEI